MGNVAYTARLPGRVNQWLQRLLVLSSGQRDIIKTVALLMMAVDHINLLFHLEQTWMFLVGRGAFPLFALMWGLNLARYEQIPQESVYRLWGWAVIAQFGYFLAGFPWYEGNILFTFAVAAQLLKWCENRALYRSATAMLLLVIWIPLSETSYGIVGLLMLAFSYRLYRTDNLAERLILAVFLVVIIFALNLMSSDLAAIAGLVLTVLVMRLVSYVGKSLPRFWPSDFFPIFYAFHLVVLGILAP